MKRDDDVYIQDMISYAQEAIKACEAKDLDTFRNDRILFLAVIKLIQVVGEAGSHVSESTRLALPHVPWREIVGMRNILVHQYYEADDIIVWKTVKDDLPPLLASLERWQQIK